MRLEFTGFAPDLDPATPGILTDCDGIVPTVQGLAAANSPVDSGYPALESSPVSAYAAHMLDGSRRAFAATSTKIYEATAGTWTDRSRVGDYTTGFRMRFTVFGNAVLAANRSQPINQSTTGAFADIAGAPQATYIVTASGFVVALNINGMTLGDAPDGWGCCAIRNQVDWTPDIATQCAAGRLLDSPGPITGAEALGGDVVAYKGTSMYLGRYVGPPLVWAWTRVPGDVGCVAGDSIVSVDSRHYFIGPDDFYVFDGTVPRPIGNPIRNWFFGELDQLNRHKIVGSVDMQRDLIYWFYPSKASGGALDSVLFYNYRTDRWGKQAMTVQAVMRYPGTSLTYDTFYEALTYDELPEVAYDSPFWQRDDTIPGLFQEDLLYSLSGNPGATWLKTGLIGDLVSFSRLNRVTPSYRTLPEGVSVTNFTKSSYHAQEMQVRTAEMFKERFDFRSEARWHSLRFDQAGAAVLTGADIDVIPTTPQ